MKKSARKVKLLSLFFSLFTVVSLVMVAEPGSMEGATSSDVIGLTLAVSEDITITSPSNVDLGTINLSTSDVNGSAVWTVVTNATGGYTLKLKATTDTAMKNATDQITDYTEAVLNTPESWSIAAGAYEFGYGTYGTGNTDVSTATWGTGANCTNAYYVGPATTQSVALASRSSETSQSGIATTVCFRAAQGGSVYIPAGTFTATVTAYAATQ